MNMKQLLPLVVLTSLLCSEVLAQEDFRSDWNVPLSSSVVEADEDPIRTVESCSEGETIVKGDDGKNHTVTCPHQSGVTCVSPLKCKCSYTPVTVDGIKQYAPIHICEM